MEYQNPTRSGDDAPVAVEPAVAPVAVQKFRSCRWRRPAEDEIPDCCSHRDVLPLTGAHGFDPTAWCTECAFFKLRRTPRKPEAHFIR